MGIGRSNQEEVIWDPLEGVKLTDDLINYPIALMNDCEAMECYQIETGLNYCAYGASGIGESGGANVCNLTRYAVHNAIGKWVDLKTKPDKILKALGKI
jgi:CO/xanthine dehydrogenase Mo-binding subunit